MEICPSNPNRSLRSNIDWVSQLKNYYKQLSMIVAELSKKQPTSIEWKTPTTPSPGNVMHGPRTKTMSQRDDLNMEQMLALCIIYLGLIVSRPFRIIWSLITKFQCTDNCFSFRLEIALAWTLSHGGNELDGILNMSMYAMGGLKCLQQKPRFLSEI